ncbi:MAG: hypothetical protein HDR38_02495 [Treponema sp.]|nr:hypothetical protein [Treponema sp.]
MAGTTRKTVPDRDKKATRPRHGRGKQLSDDNDLIFRCGKLFEFCKGFLSHWDGYYHFDNGLLLRSDDFSAFATTFFRVGMLIATLQRLSFALGRSLQFCNCPSK